MKPEDFIHFPEAPTPTVYIQYKLYEKQQRLRRPSQFGAEIFYQFEAKRKVEEYYEWIVNINIETFDMRDIEVVMKDGTKKKMSKGRIWVQLYGNCDTDYEKVWEKSAFLAQLKGFYNKYIVKKRFEGIWWDELYYKIVLRFYEGFYFYKKPLSVSEMEKILSIRETTE